MWEKTREPENVTKVQLHVMLVQHNVRIVPSNVRKKIKELPNVTKVQLHVILIMHNVRVVPSNVRKYKWTIKCDKSTITSDVSTTQREDGTIKCDVLVTWYNRLPTSGYHTRKQREGIVELLEQKIPCFKYFFIKISIAKFGTWI